MGEDTEMDPQRAEALIRDGAVQLVDVRQPHEVEAGRLAGARHVELAELAAQAETISRDTPVLFYCATGARSGMATSAFRQAGYEAYNLAGGIEAWEELGLAVER
jgi:rhodanese-related sulfurtransferase